MAARLFLCALLFYLLFAHGNFVGSDEVGVFESTRAIWEQGNLVVPDSAHVFPGADGRLFNHFAIAQSLLALPFYGLGKLAGAYLPDSWVRALAAFQSDPKLVNASGSVEVFCVALYSQVASALLVALFFLLQRQLGVSTRSALLCSVLLATTTYVAMMSVYFLRHTTESLAILGSFSALHAYKEHGRLRALALGCLLAALTLVIRVPAAIAGGALAGYMLFAVRARAAGDRDPPPIARTLAAIALPVAAVTTLHTSVNHIKWGTWIASPMLAQAVAFVTPLHVGVAGFLLSPGVSIFAYSPLLLLAPFGVIPFWQQRRAECVTVLALCLSFLVVCAKFELWTGLWSSPGPRYLFVVTPLLMLALGFWLDEAKTRRRYVAVAALSALGAVAQLVLLTARWPMVIRTMGYKSYEPELGFIWLIDQSPILGSARVLGQGQIDNWLWILAQGWTGREAQPAAAVAILGAWAVCFALALRGLRNAVRASGGAGLSPRDPLVSP